MAAITHKFQQRKQERSHLAGQTAKTDSGGPPRVLAQTCGQVMSLHWPWHANTLYQGFNEGEACGADMASSHSRECLESEVQVVNSMSVMCPVSTVFSKTNKNKKLGKVFIINKINTNKMLKIKPMTLSSD